MPGMFNPEGEEWFITDEPRKIIAQRRAIRDAVTEAVIIVPIAGPRRAVGVHLPRAVLVEIILVGGDEVEPLLAEQLHKEAVLHVKSEARSSANSEARRTSRSL